jgi:acetylornithine deacetylase/succinyl-diaminopimelate desuccinylase-like protein
MKLKIAALLSISLLFILAQNSLDPATRELSRDIFKQLIEINTSHSVGSTTVAAEAMARRLSAAGFPSDDVKILVGSNPKRGNLVARYRAPASAAHKKPILFICHLDVVEANRSDWSLDPFTFTEKDGYFYGRGTEDIKDGDTFLVTSFIRLKKEGYQPDRDLILALTADEEGGPDNGVDFLIKNHRDLIDAEFVINPDAGDFEMDHGKKLVVGVQAAEKLYQDFTLKVTSPGGHSSLPTSDNAIDDLAEGLSRLAQYKFPVQLSELTRAYFAREADIVGGQDGADMKAILRDPPDQGAVDRLSATPFYNARLRTTCVPTLLSGGHAPNALPALATANVNCRILPGHSPEEVQATLVKVVDSKRIEISPVLSGGIIARAAPPSPLTDAIMKPLEKASAEMWPGVPVIPVLDSGASDGAIARAAGLPTYGVPGAFIDINDDRSHGRDERLPVSSFYEGVQFYYLFIKALSSP